MMATMILTISPTRAPEVLTLTSTASKRVTAAEMAAQMSVAYWPGAVTPSKMMSEKIIFRKHAN